MTPGQWRDQGGSLLLYRTPMVSYSLPVSYCSWILWPFQRLKQIRVQLPVWRGNWIEVIEHAQCLLKRRRVLAVVGDAPSACKRDSALKARNRV